MTIGGLANSYSHYCATYEEYHDQRYEAGSGCTGHTLSMLTFRSSQEPPFHLQHHCPRQSYSCITSPNSTENYAPEGSCVIKLASLKLDVKGFETEVLWDTVVVNCRICSESTGLVGVEADGEISCFSDEAGRERVSPCMST